MEAASWVPGTAGCSLAQQHEMSKQLTLLRHPRRRPQSRSARRGGHDRLTRGSSAEAHATPVRSVPEPDNRPSDCGCPFEPP